MSVCVWGGGGGDLTPLRLGCYKTMHGSSSVSCTLRLKVHYPQSPPRISSPSKLPTPRQITSGSGPLIVAVSSLHAFTIRSETLTSKLAVAVFMLNAFTIRLETLTYTKLLSLTLASMHLPSIRSEPLRTKSKDKNVQKNLISYDTDTQYARFRGNPLRQATD